VLIYQVLSDQIIGAAIEVHRNLGPGLLERAYEACLCHELKSRNIPFTRQLALPVPYKECQVPCGFRIDLLVADLVIVEIKAVEHLYPIHEAQLMTYLRLAKKKVGLLFNFNVKLLREGLIRRVL
jgi:GxxExxY protein